MIPLGSMLRALYDYRVLTFDKESKLKEVELASDKRG